MSRTTESRLVEVWDTYIHWSKRAEGEAGFFAETLKRFCCKTVFDTSMGTGFDRISLTKAGFLVQGNEFDSFFRERAKQNILKEGLTLEAITGYDWRELSSRLNEQFDAVLCVGNSLCYLLEREEQLKALREFFALLPKGGIAVVDHRNYEYMLTERKFILENPREHFRYSKKYYYCSDVIVGYPSLISPRKVNMEIFDVKTQMRCGIMPTYPFRKEELTQLLYETGFERVETYGDFKKDFNPNTVDFFQHVAIK